MKQSKSYDRKAILNQVRFGSLVELGCGNDDKQFVDKGGKNWGRMMGWPLGGVAMMVN